FLPGSRTVMIDGEAFFEVAHDPVRPFYVEKSGTTIRVLGTRFNMEAYEGFPLRTSLLEGAVRVIKGKDSIEIKPGQQAEVDKVIHLNRNVDMEKVTAWKAGFFNFDGDGLREVMQQLESWYDIEVVYRGNIPEVEFYGKLHRTTSLEGVLKALQLSNIRYTITSNKKLILEP
ncbi:MAG TPA: FecR domain-containing protein, partial [Niabella sp.]|nr:FecR domain-containing protein [Niabella sp.]